MPAGTPGASSTRPSARAEATPAKRSPGSGTAYADAFFQAVAAIGVDYRYGGGSPATGFDCSGLVAHVYREAWGIELPHNALAQSEIGRPVEPAELQPGDLVFYNTQNRPFSHVGIYVGEARFVHAPKAGAQVRLDSLRERYWAQRYDGARRLDPALAAR